MTRMKYIATVAAFTIALSACQPQVPQLPQQFENPMQQAPLPQAQEEGFDVGDAAVGAAVGAAAGYMLGNSGSRTTVIDNRRPDYGYRNSGYNRGYSKKTVTTTTVKRGLFGKKTITRTVTKRRR